jgi:galactokinase
MAELSDHRLEKIEIARIAHRAETDFVGMPCGIMDQFASALSVEDAALLIDCRTEDVKAVPLEMESQNLALVVVDSGASRELASSAYAERREECREACRILRGPLARAVTSLRDVSLEDLALVGDQLPRTLRRRARHVVSENGRVIEFVATLRDRRLDHVGALMAESHRSLRDDYEVSSTELDLLVELAGRAPGVVGARLTGAGFGGCTVNIVRKDMVGRFREDVVEEYKRRTGRKAALHVCRPAGGVLVQHL